MCLYQALKAACWLQKWGFADALPTLWMVLIRLLRWLHLFLATLGSSSKSFQNSHPRSSKTQQHYGLSLVIIVFCTPEKLKCKIFLSLKDVRHLSSPKKLLFFITMAVCLKRFYHVTEIHVFMQIILAAGV